METENHTLFLNSINMATNESVETNARSKVFENIFGADSFDCRFEFIDEATNEVKAIGAHRKVLSSISPVFATMFNGSWVEINNAVVVKDASFESFDAFVKYFYQDRIDLNVDNVVDLLTLADRYDVQELVAHCESYMLKPLSTDNVLKYFAVAVRFSRSGLMEKCERLFIDKPDSILRSSSFTGCDAATLTAFLRMVSQSADIKDVFDACIVWAETKCEENGKDKTSMDNLRSALGECFQLIRFKEMPFEAIAERYKRYKLLFTKNESDDILEYLLANTKTRCYFQSPNQEILKCVGTWLSYGVELSNSICFKLSERLLLVGISFAGACVDNEYVPFSGVIRVREKQKQLIVEHTAYLSVDNFSFTFPQKILIDAGKIYQISCDLPTYTYTIFRRQKVGDVEFIPIQEKNDEIAEEVVWTGTEIRFIVRKSYNKIVAFDAMMEESIHLTDSIEFENSVYAFHSRMMGTGSESIGRKSNQRRPMKVSFFGRAFSLK